MDIVSDIRSRIPRRTLLEEVTVYDIPVYMHESDIINSSQFRDTIIIGMRKKYNTVFELLLRDYKDIQIKFIEGCKKQK